MRAELTDDYMPDIVDDIKARLSIEQVVSGYIEIKKAGRNFKACCPFHGEKTPSFVVSPEKQLAYCFGCHKGGDLFTFVEEIEGVDFKTAVRILADKAGLRPEDYREKDTKVGNGRERETRKDRLLALNELTAQFYQQQLSGDLEGAISAREYLQSRGIGREDFPAFRIGYAPDSFDLTHEFLARKGFTRAEMLAAGIVVSKDTGSEHVYDRFRHRVMFPIFSHTGQVLAFGGRVIRNADEPKYLNSPETELYNKGSVLYGFKAARQAIKEQNFVVIVEGYMDVIASHRVGVKNVVASSGTALSEKQGQILKRFTSDFRLCFDSDIAGQQAARRAIESLQPLNVSLKIVAIGDKDPDELIRHHPEKWAEAINNAEYYFDYFLRKTLQGRLPNNLDEKKAVLSDLLPLLKKIRSSMEQDEYVRRLATFLATKPEIIYAEMKQIKFLDYGKMPSVNKAQISINKPNLPQYFLGLLLSFPELAKLLAGRSQEFEKYLSEAEKYVYLHIVNHYTYQANFRGLIDSIEGLEDEEKKRIALLALYAEEKNALLSDESCEKEFREICEKLHRDYRKQRINELKVAMKKARECGGDEKMYVQEFNALIIS